MVGQQKSYYKASYIIPVVLVVGGYLSDSFAQINPRLDGNFRFGIESLIDYQEYGGAEAGKGGRERRRAAPDELRRNHRTRNPGRNPKIQEISDPFLLNVEESEYSLSFLQMQNR